MNRSKVTNSGGKYKARITVLAGAGPPFVLVARWPETHTLDRISRECAVLAARLGVGTECILYEDSQPLMRHEGRPLSRSARFLRLACGCWGRPQASGLAAKQICHACRREGKGDADLMEYLRALVRDLRRCESDTTAYPVMKLAQAHSEVHPETNFPDEAKRMGFRALSAARRGRLTACRVGGFNQGPWVCTVKDYLAWRESLPEITFQD